MEGVEVLSKKEQKSVVGGSSVEEYCQSVDVVIQYAIRMEDWDNFQLGMDAWSEHCEGVVN
ncbi:MAG: hypothetical protein COW03_14955 [Cytophagales bacterium CG12_big_fil_rev_8_21_14_0_65_40_12]|nr:MAG: hypothetical protein COW03_14955 [Cytophagales bacterium CG12_big_fil_rev_8_21_14_0_65_40_12]